MKSPWSLQLEVSKLIPLCLERKSFSVAFLKDTFQHFQQTGSFLPQTTNIETSSSIRNLTHIEDKGGNMVYHIITYIKETIFKLI